MIKLWTFEILGVDFFYIFYFFFITAFIGWIYESCFVSFKEHRIVNRGFLTGPIIPIYGAGGTCIMLTIQPFSSDYVLVFLSGMIVASLLEFVTSWVMEKLFHAKWWDYSRWKLNIQGRICLAASLFWGLLSITMQLFIKPALDKLIYKIPFKEGCIFAYVIFAVFMTDTVTTVISTVNLDKKLTEFKKLRTEFVGFIESTALYKANLEFRNEMQSHIADTKFGEMLSIAHGKFEEFKSEAGLSEIHSEITEKLSAMQKQYQSRVEKISYIQLRLIKAFPDIKFTEVDDEFKEWLSNRIEERIDNLNK